MLGLLQVSVGKGAAVGGVGGGVTVIVSVTVTMTKSCVGAMFKVWRRTGATAALTEEARIRRAINDLGLKIISTR